MLLLVSFFTQTAGKIGKTRTPNEKFVVKPQRPTLRTYLHILSRKFVGISTLHTSKSAANSRYQGLEFTAVPLTGVAL